MSCYVSKALRSRHPGPEISPWREGHPPPGSMQERARTEERCSLFLHPCQPFCSETCRGLFQIDPFGRAEPPRIMTSSLNRSRWVSTSFPGGSACCVFFQPEQAFQCLSSPSNESGCGPDAEVFRPMPVGGVVAGAKTRQGVVRNLVMLESGGGKRLVHREELLLADLFLHDAELAPCRTAAEGRIGFDGQMVCRNVLYAERQHPVERSFQRIPAEAGNAEDQVRR